MLTASGARARLRCDEIGVAPFSDTPDGLFRAYLTPAHRAALDRLGAWMREAGMTVRLDPAGTLIGRYEGLAADAPAVLIGSHIDSVRDGGRYDGPLGVLLGVECVAALHAAARRLPFAVEVVAFGDEEGSRFPASMLCSRAMAGTLADGAAALVDAEGVTLTDALAAFELDVERLSQAARPSASALAYLEAHIEQGPVLEAEALAVGVVTGVAAQLRFQVEVVGRAGHAGTTSMSLRRDALAAAAEAVLAVERVAQAGPEDLVATVGRLSVAPGATNVIPGRVAFSLDVRAGAETVRDAAATDILAALDRIGVARDVASYAERVQDLAAMPCDPRLVAALERAVAAEGITPRRLVSGAGHDAMVMAKLCPTAMLFIRCKGGISHNPAESVEDADCETALAVMRRFIDDLEAALGA